MSVQTGTLWTIGHSNRSLEDFAEMLRNAGAHMVVDVRSFPRSRTNPQFNIEVLPEELATYQIGYEHWPTLGGRRKAQGNVPDPTNGFWENRSFHNYADYALSAPFGTALEALMDLAKTRSPALMCSEAVWWRCHRRIIADHLLARGVEVLHIMDIGKVSAASLTLGAVVLNDGTVEYPAR